jgi:hypothetical protein
MWSRTIASAEFANPKLSPGKELSGTGCRVAQVPFGLYINPRSPSDSGFFRCLKAGMELEQEKSSRLTGDFQRLEAGLSSDEFDESAEAGVGNVSLYFKVFQQRNRLLQHPS